MVELLKFYGRKDCAAGVADVFLHFIMKLGLRGEVALVPIPASRKGRRERGYDQMTLVARHLARRLARAGVDCRVCHAFCRTDSGQQKWLGRKRRLEGCRLALRNTPVRIGNADIIIIDDICTTGATLLSAIRLIGSGLDIESGLGQRLQGSQNLSLHPCRLRIPFPQRRSCRQCDEKGEGKELEAGMGRNPNIMAMAWLGAVYGQ